MGNPWAASKNQQYLAQYPRFEKWINHCVTCGAVGYKPELAEKFETAGQGKHQLMSMFSMLALDEDHRCEVCSSALMSNKP